MALNKLHYLGGALRDAHLLLFQLPAFSLLVLEELYLWDTVKAERGESIREFPQEYYEHRASRPDDFIAPHT